MAAKGTTVKDALAKWEEKTGEKCAEATVVKLYNQIPPIEKLDNTLNKIPKREVALVCRSFVTFLNCTSGGRKWRLCSGCGWTVWWVAR
ncbi:dynein axonemal light chain 1-like [Entelurus aequoreus]|uniref:dynein axonemal light chain 1-like n=1 Tax=Entelurus aequoreus TaxID=161455 RepID=UPI002B1E171B|nr:dynein axonemal light chain 1-like [Entelurus aequoreus]